MKLKAVFIFSSMTMHCVSILFLAHNSSTFLPCGSAPTLDIIRVYMPIDDSVDSAL